ncbi:MAG TPA: hypothetical protein VGM92_01220 [Candidatus Kapabacteria bacterium]
MTKPLSMYSVRVSFQLLGSMCVVAIHAHAWNSERALWLARDFCARKFSQRPSIFEVHELRLLCTSRLKNEKASLIQTFK